MKTIKLIQTLAATTMILAATSAWAMEQDNGYPWYGELPDQERQAVSQSSNVKVTPVLPSAEDTGYPWYAEVKEENKSTMKPVTIFKPHSRTAQEDTGYPWYADIKEDNPA